MNSKNNPQNSFVEFIEDEDFNTFRKHQSETEKGTLSIYIFASLIFLFLMLTIMWHSETIDWFNVLIYALVIIIYFCLAVYSKHEPYTTFICTICAVALVTIAEVLLTAEVRAVNLVFKAAFIVFLFLKIESAKNVQQYKKRKQDE